MRPPDINRSPRMTRLAGSIVTSVPFFMRIDDISHKEAQKRHKQKPHKENRSASINHPRRALNRNYFPNFISYPWRLPPSRLKVRVLLELEAPASPSRLFQSVSGFLDCLSMPVWHSRVPDR